MAYLAGHYHCSRGYGSAYPKFEKTNRSLFPAPSGGEKETNKNSPEHNSNCHLPKACQTNIYLRDTNLHDVCGSVVPTVFYCCR